MRVKTKENHWVYKSRGNLVGTILLIQFQYPSRVRIRISLRGNPKIPLIRATTRLKKLGF